MWLGRVLPLRRLGRSNDVSYGVYVYAWPVQELLMFTAIARWPAVWLAVVSMAATLPAAFLSWRLVKHRALGLKSMRLPSRSRPKVVAAAPEGDLAIPAGPSDARADAAQTDITAGPRAGTVGSEGE
jgi:peptidoglycan/LPS O-acetylase OafA/YrhL